MFFRHDHVIWWGATAGARCPDPKRSQSWSGGAKPVSEPETWSEILLRYPGSTLVEAASRGVAVEVPLHAADLDPLADLLEEDLPDAMKGALAAVGAAEAVKIA
jgi:hypothetical protein